jgi:hypothetical protein
MALRPIQARTRLAVGVETLLIARTAVVTTLVVARTAIVAALVVARSAIVAALIVARTTVVTTLTVARTTVITTLAVAWATVVARATIIAALAITRAAIVATLTIAEAVLRLGSRGDRGGVGRNRIGGRLLADRGDGGSNILGAGGDRLGGYDLAYKRLGCLAGLRITVQGLAIGAATTAATATTTTTTAAAVTLLLRITRLPGLVGETLGAFLVIALVISRRCGFASNGGEIEDLGSSVGDNRSCSRDGSRYDITGR